MHPPPTPTPRQKTKVVLRLYCTALCAAKPILRFLVCVFRRRLLSGTCKGGPSTQYASTQGRPLRLAVQFRAPPRGGSEPQRLKEERNFRLGPHVAAALTLARPGPEDSVCLRLRWLRSPHFERKKDHAVERLHSYLVQYCYIQQMLPLYLGYMLSMVALFALFYRDSRT